MDTSRLIYLHGLESTSNVAKRTSFVKGSLACSHLISQAPLTNV